MVRCVRADRPPNIWGGRQSLTVGLLGGSFNPAHDGHRHVAESALRLLGLDQVWLLVSPQNPLKSRSGMAPVEQRLSSARQSVADHPRLIATDLEQALGTRYTADTLAALRRRFPLIRFVWLMGADNLHQMSLWRRWAAIFGTVPVAILARSPYSLTALASVAARRFARFRLPSSAARGLSRRRPPAWVYLHTSLHPASSTAIRSAQRDERT